MDTSHIERALTNDALIDAMEHKSDRKMIVDGLVYDKTILMIAAEPGLGKSTVSAQAAVEMAAGLPVFGFYQMPKPIKVFYIQAERPIMELLERFKAIQQTYPLVKENIVITDAYQGFNLLNKNDVDLFFECLRRDMGGAELIMLDPIYCTVAGGLKDDKPASAFTKVMSLVQREFGCCLWYNHHTVKNLKDGQGAELHDPFYGSQWLKAHVTGSYYMKGNGDVGVTLNRRKDNYDILTKRIPLEYNPETGLSSVIDDELYASDKLKNFLKAKLIDKKQFTFKDMKTYLGVCTRTLRGLVVHSSIKDRLKLVSSYGNRNLYESVNPV